MLGFAALAEVALAEVPEALTGFIPPGPAWKRLWLHQDRRHSINRDAPHELVWNDEEEEFIIQMLS